MIARSLIASALLLTSSAAFAAPPASCASKFVGEWRHSGSGNRGSVLRDGRALCSEHPACVQGTWTCEGNVLIYTNSLGSWNYTLAPDGRTMSTGTAVSTRIGPVPASARSAPPASPRNPETKNAETDRPVNPGNPVMLWMIDKYKKTFPCDPEKSRTKCRGHQPEGSLGSRG